MRSSFALLLICLSMIGLLGATIECNSGCHDHHNSDGDYRHCHNNSHHDDHRDGDREQNSSAQVTVLVTDHPLDDVDEFLVTITEATFLEEREGPRSVYRSDVGRRIDLLTLRGDRDTRLYDVLASGGLPPGNYNAIELTVRDPMMTLISGEVLEAPEIELVGDGEIVIELADPLVLERGDAAHVVLDFDLSSSLVRADALDGATGRDVRPIVLADVLYDEIEDVVRMPMNLHGRLSSSNKAKGLFTLELQDDRGRVDFRLIDSAELLDRSFDPISEDALVPGTDIRVRAYPTATGEFDVERVQLEPIANRSQARWIADENARRRQRSERNERPRIDDPPEPIRGVVTRVRPLDESLTVAGVDGSRERVWVSPETQIVVVDVTDDGVWQTPIPMSEVERGTNVVVHGRSGHPARLVLVLSD